MDHITLDKFFDIGLPSLSRFTFSLIVNSSMAMRNLRDVRASKRNLLVPPADVEYYLIE